MSKLEKYYSFLDKEASKEHQLAEKAREQADERETSIHLMRESMLGDMLRALGKVRLENPENHALENLLERFGNEQERYSKKQDADLADRAKQKCEVIRLALDAVKALEAQDE